MFGNYEGYFCRPTEYLTSSVQKIDLFLIIFDQELNSWSETGWKKASQTNIVLGGGVGDPQKNRKLDKITIHEHMVSLAQQEYFSNFTNQS